MGTLASLGDRGLDVRAAYARALGLAEPDITWHVARDGLVEMVQTLAVICGALGKIGYDVMILMANEIGEVFKKAILLASRRFLDHAAEAQPDRVGKHPGRGKISRDAASLMHNAMVQDLERATGPWQAEALALPQACVLTAGSLAQAQFMLSGLIVEPAAMRRNLDSTRGLIVAEAVMMGLAPVLGRQPAHDEVYAACRDAFTRSEPLLDALLRRPAIASACPATSSPRCASRPTISEQQGAMVDRVLARHTKR